MELRIRNADEGDLPAVLRLYGQPGVDDGHILDVDAATAILRRFATYPNYRLFVAEEDDDVVGSYALLIMDNLGHLGRGIGQAMMEHAMKAAREAGAYKLMLSSNASRERAHAFYERLVGPIPIVVSMPSPAPASVL